MLRIRINRTAVVLLAFVAAVFATLLPACKKADFNDVDFAEHSSEFAFPLFNTAITIQDLLTQVLNEAIEGDTLVVNSDNTLTLIYNGDVAAKPATDIFKDLLNGTIPLVDTFFQAPFAAPTGVKIYETLLKSGTMRLGVLNTTSEMLTVTMSIPQMTKDGQVFSITVTAWPGIPTASPQVPVAGYLLQSDSNKLEFRYEAIRPNGERIELPEPQPGVPAAAVAFENIEFSYIEGYWEQQVYPLTRDTIEIDINQTDLNGQVTIKNPVVTFRVGNSWGFETRGLIKYLSFLTEDGTEYPLTSTAFNNDSIDFAFPDTSEVGQTKITEVVLDELNSNIGQIFNAQPVQLIYEVCGIANPGNDTTRIGFITDSSLITLGVRVELLLEGSAKDFAADQTLDLDFGDYSDLDTAKIQSVEFKLVTENTMPITANLQLYFLDTSDVIIDSLFTGGAQPLIRAAAVDANGVSQGVERTEHLIPMDIARFNRVRRADKAKLETSFTTSDGGTVPVKLLANNQAVVKMGLKVKTRWPIGD
jgi:hypothetical protein